MEVSDVPLAFSTLTQKIGQKDLLKQAKGTGLFGSVYITGRQRSERALPVLFFPF